VAGNPECAQLKFSNRYSTAVRDRTADTKTPWQLAQGNSQ